MILLQQGYQSVRLAYYVFVVPLILMPFQFQNHASAVISVVELNEIGELKTFMHLDWIASVQMLDLLAWALLQWIHSDVHGCWFIRSRICIRWMLGQGWRWRCQRWEVVLPVIGWQMQASSWAIGRRWSYIIIYLDQAVEKSVTRYPNCPFLLTMICSFIEGEVYAYIDTCFYNYFI
jgi:hypothetical protein